MKNYAFMMDLIPLLLPKSCPMCWSTATAS